MNTDGYFELVLDSLGKNPTAADNIIFGIIKGDFIFHIEYGILCVCSLCGDSNENTQYIFMVKKNRKDILIMPPDLAL